MLGTAKGPAVSWCGLEGRVPQGADSGMGAEGVWLEDQNSCVFLNQCAESSSLIHPCHRKRRVLFWGIPAARGAQCQQRGCPAEPTAPSGRAPSRRQTACAGTGLPSLMRHETRDQPTLWRGNLSGGYLASESLGPSCSMCFLGPASPTIRVKPSKLPAAELLWLLMLNKNIDFL